MLFSTLLHTCNSLHKFLEGLPYKAVGRTVWLPCLLAVRNGSYHHSDKSPGMTQTATGGSELCSASCMNHCDVMYSASVVHVLC